MNSPPVMPGLVPGIHAFAAYRRLKALDGRDKPGHDEVLSNDVRHCEERSDEAIQLRARRWIASLRSQ
ncbi:hypothetical protein D4Q52_25095 [Rhodopseudomonas palustris]|uniref:Uncharacterized protein n=1 Tax=Rhodopseudomonas palustris TaxID=1076 RepID=A0A418UXG4_RHOPL|nr:hypothetical protein D4Q52_25095 [Rhodopseudomonas palustris]